MIRLRLPASIRFAGAASIALSVMAAGCGCGRSKGVSDDKLGGLVIPEVKDAEKKVDLEKAVKDPVELGRVLAQPHGKLVDAFGPHVAKLASSSQLVGANPLADTVVIEIGDKGAFHGLYTNTADYGRETIFVDGKLYLRPRYQRWHARAPESTDEPAQLRDAYFEAVFATWDLLAPAAELTDRGKIQVEGRVGRKIEIAQSSKPRQLPEEKLAQRRWRQSRTIDGVTGEIVVDAEKGVLLSAKLAGNVSFTKDGQRYSMKVTVEASITSIGAPVAVVPPATGEIVATPERLREVDDRDYLLQNIAPPLRRNPDGTAATPQPVSPPSGSAAEPAKTDSKSEKDKKSDKSDKKKSDEKSETKSEPPKSDEKSEKKSDEKSEKKSDEKSEDKP